MARPGMRARSRCQNALNPCLNLNRFRPERTRYTHGSDGSARQGASHGWCVQRWYAESGTATSALSALFGLRQRAIV